MLYDQNQFKQVLSIILTCFVYQVCSTFYYRWSYKGKKPNLRLKKIKLGLQDQIYHKLNLERYYILYQLIYDGSILFDNIYTLVYTTLNKIKNKK